MGEKDKHPDIGKYLDEYPQLTNFQAQQIKLFIELKKFAEKCSFEIMDLAGMYYAALTVLSDDSNKDRIAQAAHSLREVLYNFGPRYKMSRGQYLKIKPVLLEGVKVADPRGIGPHRTLEEDLYTPINSIYSQLSDLAHHSPDVHRKYATDDTLLNKLLTEYEQTLLEYLFTDTAKDIRQLEKLVKIGNDNPEAVFLEIKPLLSKGYPQWQYFCNIIASEKWIGLLGKHGLVAEILVLSDPRDHMYSYPLLDYFSRIVYLRPKEVTDVIRKISNFEDYLINRRILEIALKSPMKYACKLARWVIKKDFVAKPNNELILNDINKLISKLGTPGTMDTALRLLINVLDYIPGCGRTSDIVKLKFEDRKRIDNNGMRAHFFKKLCTEIAPVIVKWNQLEGFEDVCEILRKVVDYKEGRKTNIPRDHSYINRPSIEDHEKNDQHSVYDALISCVRASAELILEENPENIGEVVAALKSKEWGIFHRIALHLLCNFPLHAKDIIEDYLGDRQYYDDDNYHREYILLAQEQFEAMPKELQGNIIARAKEFESEEEYEKWYEEFHQEKAPKGEYQKVKEGRILYGLEPFAEFLKGADKKLYDELVVKYKVPETHEYIQSWSEAGFVVDVSPVTKEEILGLSDDELFNLLNTFRPTDEWRGPSRTGLVKELQATVCDEPDRFVACALRFQIEGQPWYPRGFFNGLRDALKAERYFKWENVLKLAKWAIERRDSEVIELKPHNTRRIGDWDWCCTAIVDLIKDGLNNASDAGMEIHCRNDIWEIIEPLVKTPQPELEGGATKDNTYDPYMDAINCTRGRAFETLITYSLWILRSEEEQFKGDGKYASSFESKKEVKEALEHHLYKEEKPSLAIRSVYGRWFPWLVTLDKGWAVENTSNIFPRDNKKQALHKAAWNTYVIFNRPYDNVLEILQDEYKIAIDAIGDEPSDKWHPENPDFRLADHLLTWYWWGKITFESPDGMLKLFYEKANPRVRAHGISFIGNSLRDAEGEIKPEIIERLKHLWEKRIKAAQKDIEGCSEEISHFTWWFSSGAFEPEWLLDQLDELLKLGVIPDFITEVVSSLVVLTTKHPLRCLRTLQGVLNVGRDTIAEYFWERHAKEVLQIAWSSEESETEPEIKMRVQNLVNEFMELGYFDFKEILEDDDE